MSDNLNAKDILEWYLWAGVDETCGDIPFILKPEAKKNIDAPEHNVRLAMTGLAQNTGGACQNANDICARVQSLEELKTEVEKFDGCALKKEEIKV